MELNEWIVKGRTGASSKTMWAVFAGVETAEKRLGCCRYDIPYDPSDFGRCYDLVKDCKLENRLSDVSKVFPAWRPFIYNWDKLEAFLLEMRATNKVNGMFIFMRELVDDSMAINRKMDLSLLTKR